MDKKTIIAKNELCIKWEVKNFTSDIEDRLRKLLEDMKFSWEITMNFN